MSPKTKLLHVYMTGDDNQSSMYWGDKNTWRRQFWGLEITNIASGAVTCIPYSSIDMWTELPYKQIGSD